MITIPSRILEPDLPRSLPPTRGPEQGERPGWFLKLR